MHVPEAGQHAHALGRDHLGARPGPRATPTCPTAVMRSPCDEDRRCCGSAGRRSRRSACRRRAPSLSRRPLRRRRRQGGGGEGADDEARSRQPHQRRHDPPRTSATVRHSSLSLVRPRVKPSGYYGRNGNSFRIRASSGRVPYSQISNASACRTALPFSAPYHFTSAARTAGFGCAARASSKPLPALRRALRHRRQVAVDPRQPLVHLRDVRIQHVDLLLDHIVDRDRHVGAEGCGRWKPSWKYMNTGFFRKAGVSVATFGTTTM